MAQATLKEKLFSKPALFLMSLFSLIIIIVLPLSFSYVEYYEYGLVRSQITGKVDISKVYPRGRYAIGPTNTFLKYQANAHHEQLKELSIFSASATNSSIGLEFIVDIDFTFLLIEEEVGLLHKEMATSYRTAIVNRARTAIKNEAIFISFTEYFQSRITVEQRFRDAVELQFTQNPPLHCTLDQFHMGRIRIPESVARRQLESQVQNERNDKESFFQQAQVERELTKVDVNKINLERQKLLRTTEAEASLTRAKAIAQADKITREAEINATQALFEKVGITQQDHMMAFIYLRNLAESEGLDLSIGYLSSENILKTTTVL